MQTYIEKAATLIEALPYIQNFKGKKIVIKYGGSVISEEIYCESILRDVVFMRTVGMNPIIVHGGGKLISTRLRESKINPQFKNGLRVTDEKTLTIVDQVLRQEVSKHITEIIERFGSKAKVLNGVDGGVIKCRKKMKHMGQDIDLGYVGEVDSFDAVQINDSIQRGEVPVIAPIGVDQEGQRYNINADIAAGELCQALKVDKMVYLSDIPGIMRDVDDPDTLVSSLKRSQIDPMIESKIIHGGMIPKIEACLKSIDSGARKTHIIDGRIKHSLLLEIFTDRGIGTEIVHD